MSKPVIAQFNNRPYAKIKDTPDRLAISANVPMPSVVALLEYLLDPLITIVSLFVIIQAYQIPFEGPYIVLSVITFLVSCVIFEQSGICKSWLYGGLWNRGRSVFISWIFLAGILLFLGYATKSSDEFSRQVVFTWLLVTPPLILLGNALARLLVTKFFQLEKNTRSVVIVAVNGASRRLAEVINGNSRLGMSLKGYFDDREVNRIDGTGGGKLLGSLDDLVNYAASNRVDVIYIALPMVQQKRIMKLLHSLRDTTASVYFVPDIFFFDLIQARMGEISGIPVVSVCETPFHGMNSIFKRLFDLIFSSMVLILFSPLMVLLAMGVKLSSPGPVLFCQRRYGLDGGEIMVYKFRTMTVCEDGGKIDQAVRHDKRITPFGAFLRRTSLDEFPQFINVLQGRMSVVGPRPHAVAHNEMYRKLINGYMLRHKVKPGITGWAQVHGLRGETENLEKMQARIDYDLDYLRHWSADMDIKIILKTVLLVFKDRNAY